MMSSPFLLIDGQFFKNDQLFPGAEAPDHLLFSDSVRTIRNQFMFWDEHLDLINRQSELFRLSPPLFLSNKGKELKRQLERMLVKNKLFKSARIDLFFFRKKQQWSYWARTSEIEATDYELNREGISLACSGQPAKAISPLSALPIGSELYWKILRSAALPNTELILCNTNQTIVEAAERNIFMVSGNTVSTPSAATGVYLNPARTLIRQLCDGEGLVFHEADQLTTDDLLHADEIFLAGDVQGIEWVKAFEQKRYFNKTIRRINDAFNRELIQ
ncbi:aminotransferase class IV [Gaoshiqia sp. Z1-71]|uniref:aminotransferase class IV n=1 Tax=Gaoshiqia hydrogeniformans TaxID=3290090 RepID=UPI003BF77234